MFTHRPYGFRSRLRRGNAAMRGDLVFIIVLVGLFLTGVVMLLISWMGLWW